MSTAFTLYAKDTWKADGVMSLSTVPPAAHLSPFQTGHRAAAAPTDALQEPLHLHEL